MNLLTNVRVKKNIHHPFEQENWSSVFVVEVEVMFQRC